MTASQLSGACALDRKPASTAVERDAPQALGAGDEASGRAAGHDRQRSGRQRMRLAVNDQGSSPGKHDEYDVALAVHVLGLTLALAPNEERRVELLARCAPYRAAPFEPVEVYDVHGLSVEESVDLGCGMRPEAGFAGREARVPCR